MIGKLGGHGHGKHRRRVQALRGRDSGLPRRLSQLAMTGEHGRGKHSRNERRRVAASALSLPLNSPLALALARPSGLATALALALALAAAALFIAAAILFAPLAHAAKGDYPSELATEATTADVTADDVVSNETELAVWVGEHANTGGTVALGADIVVTHGLYLGLARWSAAEDAIIRVETGNYGIRVADGGEVVLDDDVHVSGGGGLVPVIHVERGGRLGTDSSVASKASVTADGADGIALLLEEGAEFYEYYSSAISLRATGAGGIALYTHAPFGTPDIEADEYTATGHIIEATGMGGKAIVSTLPIKLFLCRVSGDVAAVEAPEVALDACAVFPEVPGAAVRTRTLRMADDTLREIGLSALGDQGRLMNLAITHRVHAELVADGAEGIGVTFNMSFDVSGVDANVLGSYPMPGNTPPAPYDLPANDFANIKIEIFDPAIPRFLSSQRLFMPPPQRYSFDYHYAGELSDLVLWRSDNDGEDWYQYWRGADGFAASENISVSTSDTLLSLTTRNPEEELSGEILFVFEVLSLQTDSRVLRVNLTESDFDNDGGIGGDRTGTDRVTDDDDNVGRGGGGNGPGTGDGGDNEGDGPGDGSGGGDNSSDGGDGPGGGSGGGGTSSGSGGGTSSGSGGTGSGGGSGDPGSSAGGSNILGRNSGSGNNGQAEPVAVITPLAPLIATPQTEQKQNDNLPSEAAIGPTTATDPTPVLSTTQDSFAEPWRGLPWYLIAVAVAVILCAAGYAIYRLRPFGKQSP